MSKSKTGTHKILLCEDDANLGMVLKEFLELHNYDVTLERDGRLGLVAFKNDKYDLCLLDVMMPNIDGFKVAEEIRDLNPDVPLFFISAKTMKEDIIQGYKLGADDYITKPFDSEVLMHKIKVILKRNDEQIILEDNIEYTFGNFHFVPRLRELTINKVTKKMTPKESELLKTLLLHKNDVVLREDALKKVWGSDSYFNSRSMDVYIAKLRKYLEPDSSVELKNVHGYGFRLNF
jgi:two-component system OmpR family response regulator